MKGNLVPDAVKGRNSTGGKAVDVIRGNGVKRISGQKEVLHTILGTVREAHMGLLPSGSRRGRRKQHWGGFSRGYHQQTKKQKKEENLGA